MFDRAYLLPQQKAFIGAAYKRHENIVRFMIDKVSVDFQGLDQETALSMAAKRGRKKVVQILVDNKANVNLRTGYARTALMMAATNGHKKWCRF